MALDFKRSWKLKEFMAHNANVNCAALGRKSGRVIVTGGDDCKVNLWAVSKETCFMSLTGHTTPIDCVKFNVSEERVCSGSRTGALKVWDLEAACLVRTLTGHRDAVRCIDFHPYTEFVASGSADSLINVWDPRRKGPILTYPSHKDKVNSVKFSPDGQWLASGSDDCTIRLRDLRTGKVLKEFAEHESPVTCVEFHPHEFLLASGSDRSVHFFDLENFSVVSSEHDLGLVRSLWFNPDGDCLFVGLRDYMKVVGWEPSRIYDSVCVNWGRICDMSTANNELVGVSYNMTNVVVNVVNLKKIRPFCGDGLAAIADSPNPFLYNQSTRKSFSKAERPMSLGTRAMDVKTIEESTSGTDPDDESSADIVNRTDYEEIFKPARALNRTPPPPPSLSQKDSEEEPYGEAETEPESLQYNVNSHAQISDGDDEDEPEESKSSLEAVSLDHNVNNYNMNGCSRRHPDMTEIVKVHATYLNLRSKSNLDQIYSSRNNIKQQKQLHNESTMNNKMPRLHHQSFKDSNVRRSDVNGMHHSVSELNLNRIGQNNLIARSRKNSLTKPVRQSLKNSTFGNISSRIPMTSAHYNDVKIAPRVAPINIIDTGDDFIGYNKFTPKESLSPKEEFVPNLIDRPVGLHMEDFLPKSAYSYGGNNGLNMSSMSSAEAINVLMGGHKSTLAILRNRQKSLHLVLKQISHKDTKSALETACAFNDPAIVVDLLGIINSKYSLWNLDICVLLLPKIKELVQSKFETYMTTACTSLRLILRHFGSVIKSCVDTPVGSFGVDISREERHKKSIACHELLEEIRTVLLAKQSLPGTVGGAIREIQTLMKNTLD